jgi:uncharacterized membrane-anchored protein
MIIFSLFILVVLNYSIYEKENIIKNGDTVLFELAPDDPRSLMQGDYMRLDYSISDVIWKIRSRGFKGYAVITVNNNNVAKFGRIYGGEKLGKNEKLIYFQELRKVLGVKVNLPESFMFQEGHAKDYEYAKYGVFKFIGPDKHVLIGLANKNRGLINNP